jgi:CubicO group peptidase (beta-lactamase class C family)
MAITTIENDFDFTELHERMDWYVNEGILPFVSTLVLKGDDVLDLSFHGTADHASAQLLAEDTIFRMHSSTKIACSVAAMTLWQQGRFKLDDAIEKYIPALANMQVLKAGATAIDQTEPANSSIQIKHIMSHTAGFSYGFIEPDSVIDSAYNTSAINPMASDAEMTLESLCESLGGLPLAYQPGTFWRYSFATDVLARLIEVVSGQRFDEYLKQSIFTPLGMEDTDFYVPEEKLNRLSTMYLPDDAMAPMSPCPTPMNSKENLENSKLPSFLSGGGGLFSSLADYLRFTRMIINEGSLDGTRILKPETLEMMRTNQCADGVGVNFPMWNMPDTTFGLGFALKNGPAKGEPSSAVGEYHWGGMAGTHFWWSPKANITGICMTQRMPGFWHPFSQEFKRLAYKIAG